MNHRQLTLKIKHPEKCDGNVLFATHKKMFYVFARYCDLSTYIDKWMYAVPAGSYHSTVDGQTYNAVFDFVISCTSGKYYIKFVSLTKKDKKIQEEQKYLMNVCKEKGLKYKEINEMSYKVV